jgi:hypothetical protein
MATLKENFVLYGASLVVAEGLCYFIERKKPFEFNRKFWIGIGLSAAIAAALVCIIFSGFFQDSNGIPNFFKAFIAWSQTGEKGNGHQKPFDYWLKIMAELEWFALLGLALAPLAIKKVVPREIRLASAVGLVLWLLYSIVAYKTPWCMLSFYWAFIFVASYWLGKWAESLKKGTSKAWVFAPLAAGFCFSLYQAYDVAYLNPDQEGHYYIYGQTFHDMMGPLNEIVAKAKANPELYKTMRIQVISSFTWPMPFVLGEFKQTGFFGENNTPAILDGDEIIMDKQYEAKFGNRLKGAYSRTEVRSRQWAGPVLFFKKTGP